MSERAIIAEVCRDDEAFLGIGREDRKMFLSRSPRNIPADMVREWIETGFQMSWSEALDVAGAHVINWVRECALNTTRRRQRV